MGISRVQQKLGVVALPYTLILMFLVMLLLVLVLVLVLVLMYIILYSSNLLGLLPFQQYI